MGKRGFILVKVKEPMDDVKTWEWIKKAEEIEDVEFVTNTVGRYDFVLNIETPETIEAVADNIKSKLANIEELVILNENNTFTKHREIKDLKIFEGLH